MSEEYLQGLLQRNEAASKTWHPMPLIKDMMKMENRPGMTILITCADPRAKPDFYLGLNPGEIPTIRNAGGRVTDDVLTSLDLLSVMGEISMLIVIHHTDCGGLFLTDKDIRNALSQRKPDLASSIQDKTWHAYHDIGLEQSIKDDVEKLKQWKFAANKIPIAGYIIDIESGKLTEVVAPQF